MPYHHGFYSRFIWACYRFVGAWLALLFLVSVATPSYAQVSARLVVEGLASPLQLFAPPDATDRRFILDQNGQVLILSSDDTLYESPFIDLSGRMVDLREGFEERGLIGFAFHPNFEKNGRFYVHYSAPLRENAPDNWDHTAVISEFTVPADNPDQADVDSERVLLKVDQVNRKTNAGALAFGPDGYLYIAMGEGGGGHGVGEVTFGALEVPERNNIWDFQAQDIHNLYGKILRIDVDQGWPGYAVPQSNPFVGKPGRDEIYAWGFRNHYRMAFDHAGNGDLMVAAVSEALWETVYQVSQPGNYGWPIREGSYCYDRQNPLSPPEACPHEGPNGWRIHDPVIQYPNLNIAESSIDLEPLGSAIVGGEVYRGTQLSDLKGAFVFADYSADPREPSGQIFQARPSGNIGALWTIEPVVQLKARAQGMGVDGDGELYVLTRESFAPAGDTGKVFKLVPTSAQTSDSANSNSNSNSNSDSDSDSNGRGSGSDAKADTSASGAFTTAQAERGKGLYQKNCQSCHASNLRGSDPFPAITGQGFFSKWSDRSVSELHQYIRGNMPLGSSGSLSDQVYADILAYWLSRHGYPSGSQPLPQSPDDVADLAIEDRRE
jgi:glucose/arabinose dehydrogenase